MTTYEAIWNTAVLMGLLWIVAMSIKGHVAWFRELRATFRYWRETRDEFRKPSGGGGGIKN